MMNRKFIIPLSAFYLSYSSALAADDVALTYYDNPVQEAFDQWNIDGNVTLQYDKYLNHGNKDISKYNYSSKPQAQILNNLNFNRSFSSFNTVKGYVNSRLNQSDLGGTETGLIVERAQINWTNGEVETPFRFLAGDYYAFFSPRTVQKSVKGASLEIQPDLDWGGNHSIVFLSGANGATFRDVKSKSDLTNGVSWGIYDENRGDLTFNYVHNFQRQELLDGATTVSDPTVQNIFSAGYSKEFQNIFLDHSWDIEGEFSYFSGDYRDGTTAIRDRNDHGYFIDVQGRSADLPLTYSAIYERYGKNFKPNGGAVSADQNRFETSVGWRFDNNIKLTGRYLNVVDSAAQSDSSHSETFGLNASGPVTLIEGENISFSYNGFIQKSNNSARSSNSRTFSNVASLNYQINQDWSSSFRTQYQDQYDIVNDQTTISRQFGIDLNRKLVYENYSGFVRPSLTLSNNSGNSGRVELTPAVTGSIGNDVHKITANLQIFDQDGKGSSTDTDTFSGGLDYTYREGPHNLQLIAEFEDKRPNEDRDNHGYYFGLRYTVSFDKPAGSLKKDSQQSLGVSENAPVKTIVPTEFSLNMVAPGGPLPQAREQLAKVGIEGAVSDGSGIVYETQILDRFFERQKLALFTDRNNRIIKSALIMEVGNAGDPRTAQRQYQRLQEVLIKKFGAPDQTLEEGDFDANFEQNVRNGNLVRVTQWRTSQGLIRLGIPQRLDNDVRFEIQFANTLPPLNITSWSLDELSF